MKVLKFFAPYWGKPVIERSEYYVDYKIFSK